MSLATSTGNDTWTGPTPGQWARLRLGNCFRERNESTTAESLSPLSVTKAGVVDQQEQVAKSQLGAPKKVARAGDFVINSRSDRKGSAGLAPRDGSVSMINIVLEPREIYPRFAHHLLRSGAFQEEFFRWGSGIVDDLWSTRYAAMKNIVLPVPPASEQRAIADYLDYETAEIDTFIADLEELLSITERRKWAVIDQAYLNAASLAEHVRLRHLATLNPSAARSYVQSDAPFRLLPMEAIHEFGPPSDGVAKTYDELKTGYSYIGTSDVAFAKVTPCFENGKGLTGYDLREPVFATTEVTVVRPDSEVDQRYLALMLQTEAFRGPAIASMTGAGGLKRVPDEYVRNFRLPLPSVSEQVRMVRDVDSELTNLGQIQKDVKNAVTLSKERRAALISAAVTGQIDITQKHRPVAEHLEDEVKQLS